MKYTNNWGYLSPSSRVVVHLMDGVRHVTHFTGGSRPDWWLPGVILHSFRIKKRTAKAKHK
jgi:hypothetical protein